MRRMNDVIWKLGLDLQNRHRKREKTVRRRMNDEELDLEMGEKWEKIGKKLRKGYLYDPYIRMDTHTRPRIRENRKWYPRVSYG